MAANSGEGPSAATCSRPAREPLGGLAVAAEEDDFRDDASAAAFLPPSVGLGHGLAGGDHDQQLPQVVAIGQLRELASRRPVAEAVERAKAASSSSSSAPVRRSRLSLDLATTTSLAK